MNQATDFINKYGGPKEWKPVIYRGELAAYNTPFGIDQGTPGLPNSLSTLRIHPAKDRPQGNLRTVYVPFDAETTGIYIGHPDFGTIVRLQVFGDFEVRIMHMNPDKDIRPEVLKTLKTRLVKSGAVDGKVFEIWEGGALQAGKIIGNPGCLGLGTGPHTHTEIVSLSSRSVIIDRVMQLTGIDPDETMTDVEIDTLLQGSKELWNLFHEQIEDRDIKVFGKYHIVKTDGRFGGQVKTWYDSKLLGI